MKVCWIQCVAINILTGDAPSKANFKLAFLDVAAKTVQARLQQSEPCRLYTLIQISI